MPLCSVSAAATSSWVDSGFEAASRTSAPPAASVSIRFAVSVVTCRQAAIRMPLQRLLLLEALLDLREHRHLTAGPLDPIAPLGREARDP